MSGRTLPSTGVETVENELLAQLGLPPSASPEDVDELHLAVSEYLAAAPAGIRGWAHAQAASLDRTYLTLTDPVGLQGSALRSPAEPPAVVPGGPATPPARRESPVAVTPAPDPDEAARGGRRGARSRRLRCALRLGHPERARGHAPGREARGTGRDGRHGAEGREGAGRRGLRARGLEPLEARRDRDDRPRGGPRRSRSAATPSVAAATTRPRRRHPRTAAQATTGAPAVDEAKVADLMAKVQADPQGRRDAAWRSPTSSTRASQYETAGDLAGQGPRASSPRTSRRCSPRVPSPSTPATCRAAETTWKQVVDDRPGRTSRPTTTSASST